MKIKNEKEILGLYVSDDILRQKLKNPFIEKNDGRVWASNSYILIMVNKECVSEKYVTRDAGNKIPVRDYNCDFHLSVSSLQNAIDRCPQEPEVEYTYIEKECPECGGTGEVEADYFANYDNEDYTISVDCPICDGLGKIKEEEVSAQTGKMIPKEDSIIKIGEGYFKWIFIDTIIETCKKLRIEELRLIRTHNKELNIIELSKDIHIGINPMNINDDRKESAIKVKGIKP